MGVKGRVMANIYFVYLIEELIHSIVVKFLVNLADEVKAFVTLSYPKGSTNDIIFSQWFIFYIFQSIVMTLKQIKACISHEKCKVCKIPMPLYKNMRL